MQPVQCDYCNKQLLGFVNQTMKCLGCGADIHNFCTARGPEFCNYPRKLPKILTSEQYTKELLADPKPIQRKSTGIFFLFLIFLIFKKKKKKK